MMTTPTIKLNNGQEMPAIGLGTFRLRKTETSRAVRDAIAMGYRHIDTASVYENEDEIGAAIRNLIIDRVIERKDLFLVTKLSGVYHDPKQTEEGCRKSLNSLGLDYIDLYLIHFPVGEVYDFSGLLSDVDYLDTWKAMENLVDKGLVRSIGLSNFNSEQIERILGQCRIKPTVNQVECHAGFNQKKLIKFARDRNITIVAYSPLARPSFEKKWPPFLFDSKTHALAKKYRKTSAQVCLRYLIQLGVAVIPKSTSPERMKENFDIFDFALSSEDMEIMDSFHTGQRTIPFNSLKNHKYYPFAIEF